MASCDRRWLTSCALFIGAALALSGCDTGGTVIIDPKPTDKPPIVGAHSGTELTNSGTLASNSKYRLFYVMGQGSPQTVTTSPTHRLNGGLTGAVHGP